MPILVAAAQFGKWTPDGCVLRERENTLGC